jgi:hypothetical protein
MKRDPVDRAEGLADYPDHHQAPVPTEGGYVAGLEGIDLCASGFTAECSSNSGPSPGGGL